MSAPAISIVLPAYNCSWYLAQTIDSLLAQTCANFELLIINDGSSDDTEEIIQSYADPRIQYIKNETNKGLIYTLNRGIGLAQGSYIARMDADDIALPQRLELQKKWLDEHPDTAIVSCTIRFIDEHNNDLGIWKEDQQTTSFSSLKKMMPWQNCLAHPTVMMRKETALRYPYHFSQLHSEDYDLWLRMLADGVIIEKVPRDLLLYRTHSASITGSILRKSNPFFKQYHCKKRFLLGRIKQGKWGAFENSVLAAAIYDGIMGMGKHIKNNCRL
jgi:glycosyltransferase involved in cell wall biosynthesis